MASRSNDDIDGDRTPRLPSEEPEAQYTSYDDEMDDDGDYELAAETTEDDEMDDEDDEDPEDEDVEIIFEDAQEQLASLLEQVVDESGGTAGGADASGQAGQTANDANQDGMEGVIFANRAQFFRLLQQAPALRYILQGGNLLDDDDDGDYYSPRRRHRRTKSETPPPVPSQEGQELMESGKFGVAERDVNRIKRQKMLAAEVMRRELGLGSPGQRRYTNGAASQVCILFLTAAKY